MMTNKETANLIKLADLYGIKSYVTFEDVYPFGDPHDVGKIHPNLANKIKKHEKEIKKFKTKAKIK